MNKCTCGADDSRVWGHGTNCPSNPNYRPPTHVVVNGRLYRLVEEE
jgi:hypothetical protein